MAELPLPQRWRALPVVLCASLLAFFDLFAVNVAVPSIQRQLDAGPAAVELIVAGYSFTYALGLVGGGRLGDRFGRHRLFLLGMAWFGLACAGCAAAPSAGLLVAARLAQGAGAAAMVPQVLALIQVMFPIAERPRALAAFGINAGLSTIAGQALGGVLLHVDLFGLGWRAVFVLQVPLAVAAVFAGRRLLPASRAASAPRLDPLGTLVLAVALALVLVPLVVGREAGWPPWSIASLVAAGPALAGFAVAQRRLARRGGTPLVDPRLFGSGAFTSGLVVTLAFYAELGSFFLVVSLFLQDGLGLGPLAAGLTFAPLGVGFAASSIAGRRMVVAAGGRAVVVGGVSVVVATLIGATAMVAGVGAGVSVAAMVPVMLMVGIGNGLALPALLGVVLDGIPDRLAGVASGVLMTAQQVGTAVGVAGIGALYFAAMAGAGVARGTWQALAADAALAALTLALVLRLPPSRGALPPRTRRASGRRPAGSRV